MSSKRRKGFGETTKERSAIWKLVVGAGLVVAIGLPLAIFGPAWIKGDKATHVTLREALAAQLTRSPESLQLNIPPAAGRYPGAILVRTPEGLLVPVTFEHRPEEVVAAPSFELDGTAVTSASAALSGTLGDRLEIDSTADEWLDVSVQLREGRVIEAALGELRKRLGSNDDVLRLRQRGRDPEVVVRAYEARCDLILRQRSGQKVKQWSEFKRAAVKSKAEIAEDGALVFRSAFPSIIAYETCSVSIISGSMSGGAAEVDLTEVLAPADVQRAPALPAPPSPTSTMFAGVASSRYRHHSMGDLPAAPNSLALMNDALSEAGVGKRLGWAQDEVLDQETFLSWLDHAAKKAVESGAAALVVYWIGHSVSLSNGQLYFVMGDYVGDLKQDLGSVDRRDKLSEPGQPMSGSNIDDLVRVLQAIEDRVPNEIPGLVPLVKVHDLLAQADVPFAVLIDGCYASEGMNELRRELSIDDRGYYFGPNAVPDMARYSKALAIYGRRPHLTSSNPVVLAAKPGTVAGVRLHPWNEWVFESPPLKDPLMRWGVGPLASRVAWNIRRSRAMGETLTWGELLSLVSDLKRGVGEVSVRGSISWSDLAVFDTMTLMLSTDR